MLFSLALWFNLLTRKRIPSHRLIVAFPKLKNLECMGPNYDIMTECKVNRINQTQKKSKQNFVNNQVNTLITLFRNWIALMRLRPPYWESIPCTLRGTLKYKSNCLGPRHWVSQCITVQLICLYNFCHFITINICVI